MKLAGTAACRPLVNEGNWSLVELEDLQQEIVLGDPSGEVALGHHLLVELHGCQPERLKGINHVESLMLEAARASKASVVTHHFHSFLPYGVSGAVIIQESHFTVHTWPEYGYAAIDLFYCSNDVDVESALKIFKEALQPTKTHLLLVRRGRV